MTMLFKSEYLLESYTYKTHIILLKLRIQKKLINTKYSKGKKKNQQTIQVFNSHYCPFFFFNNKLSTITDTSCNNCTNLKQVEL